MSELQFAPKYDLIVIGGGPAGSTLASLVAMMGHKVLLLEKQRFPRHQIGESLLPATVHGICRVLGVQQELEKAGFQRKRGGTFLWGRSSTPWTFAFSKLPNSPTGFAYQVERSKFDKILLANAARLGAQVIEECSVSDIKFGSDRVIGILCQDSGGRVHNISTTFVADASGYQSRFHRLVGNRAFSRFFQNVALYGYFRNGKRLAEPNSGNILCAAFHDGWFWYIPLSSDMTSVGVVVSKKAVETIQDEREGAFRQFVDACPLIREFLDGASRIKDGPYGELRIRKDYSYCNTTFYRNGLVLLGDAACFVDPIFSSGVHLATYSALLAARSVNSCLKGLLSQTACFGEFEYRYRKEFGKFYRFLRAFYDMHRDEHSYFWDARRVLGGNGSGEDAFISLVAGLSEEDEPVFSGIRSAGTAESLGEWFDTTHGRLRGPNETCAIPAVNGFDFDDFMPGLTSEMLQIQLQGFFGHSRPPETPLREGGLVPSADGLLWMESSSLSRR